MTRRAQPVLVDLRWYALRVSDLRQRELHPVQTPFAISA